MSKQEVYDLIRQYTKGRTDYKNNQIKLTAKEIINQLNLPENAVYVAFRALKKENEIRCSRCEAQRTLLGGERKIVKETYWWYENGRI